MFLFALEWISTVASGCHRFGDFPNSWANGKAVSLASRRRNKLHMVFSTPIFKLRKPTETWNKYFTIRSLASLPQSRGIKKKNNSCSSKKQRKSTCDKSRLGEYLAVFNLWRAGSATAFTGSGQRCVKKYWIAWRLLLAVKPLFHVVVRCF